MALLLGGLPLVVGLFRNDFWNYEEGMECAHEAQNFTKNLGLMAGLMFVVLTGAHEMINCRSTQLEDEP